MKPAVYIMTNKRNGTLYTGVTSDLVRRVYTAITLKCELRDICLSRLCEEV